MDKLRIRGGRPLNGEIPISGAKNAALPELCAALLTAQPLTLHNVPRLQDVATMLRLIRNMGVSAERGEDGSVTLNAATLNNPQAPYDLVKTMRASVLALGPLMARCGHAKVSLPGGCAIGSRPVDQHIKGLQAMGAVIDVAHGYMLAKLPPGRTRLRGARIATDMVTVTGTENFLMAMGAKIEGHGTSRILIQGVDQLHGAEHSVVADRIEAGTFLCAVAAAGGDVVLRHARGDHLEAVIDKLRDAGVGIEVVSGGLRVRAASPAHQHLKAQHFRTTEYPGFPTDMQAQFMVLNAVAHGTSKVTETIFENRFMHVNELVRLGAHIQIEGKVALVEGVPMLSGATVMATDLRASASLVIAGLVAEGETVVDRIYHLDRGYDRMEDKLRTLGADIERTQ